MSQAMDPGKPITFSGSPVPTTPVKNTPHQQDSQKVTNMPNNNAPQQRQNPSNMQPQKPQQQNHSANAQSNNNATQNQFTQPMSQPTQQMQPQNRAQNNSFSQQNAPQMGNMQPSFSPMPTAASFGDNFDEFEDLDSFDDGFGNFPSTPMMNGMDMGMNRPKSQAPQAPTLSKMTEDQRREVITRVFKLVFGRDPLDKDFNYYRFSALTEDGLIRNVLNLTEHKTLVDNAKQFSDLKSSNSELQMRVKQQDEQFKSLQSELVTLQQLLGEKNRYIQMLRGQATAAPMQPQQFQQAPVQQTQSQNITYRPTPQPAPVEQQGLTRKQIPGPFSEVAKLIRVFIPWAK